MFTGIVERACVIQSIEGDLTGKRFEIAYEGTQPEIGESVLVDGVCSTIIATQKGRFTVQYMPETLRLTTLDSKHVGDLVNIERSMTMTTLLSGHVVSGHVDATAALESIAPDGNAFTLTFALASEDGAQYLVHKGSVAINGVSLTVIMPTRRTFSVSLIPHTWQVTNLHTLKVHDLVNIEFDMIAKYVERQLIWRKEK